MKYFTWLGVVSNSIKETFLLKSFHFVTLFKKLNGKRIATFQYDPSCLVLGVRKHTIKSEDLLLTKYVFSIVMVKIHMFHCICCSKFKGFIYNGTK